MRTLTDPVLTSSLAFAAVLTVAGTLASLPAIPRPDPSPAIVQDDPLYGLLRKDQRRFTEADVLPVIRAMQDAGHSVFVVTIDPQTGDVDIELGADATPHLDIKPGSCPNTLNVRNGWEGAAAAAARVTVGVIGNAFDVTQVDVDSTRMTLFDTVGPNVTRPVHMTFDDVATPFVEKNCSCHDFEGDGILDFVAQFDKTSMIRKLPLNTFPHNTQVPLRVYGMLLEGRGIWSSRDCVRVVIHGSED